MATPAFVRQTSRTLNAVSTMAVTVTAPANGNSLVAQIMTPTGTTVASITQTNATWTRVTSATGGGGYNQIETWVALNIVSGGTTVTINLTNGPSNVAAFVAEFSNVKHATAVDDSAGAAGTGTATPSSPSATATLQTDVIVAGLAVAFNAAYVSGPTNSFTRVGTGTGWAGSGGAGATLEMAYRIPLATGSYSTGWTISGSAINTDSTIIALKGEPNAAVNPTGTLAGGGAGLRGNATNVIPANPLPLEVRVYDAAAYNGAPIAIWEGQQGLSWHDPHNAIGSASLVLLLNDPKVTAATLRQFNLVRCFLGPFDVFQFWIETEQFVIGGIGGDEKVTVAGRGLEAYLERGIVYYVISWTAATAGQVMADVIVAAQSRVALLALSMDFSTSVDSAGVAWAGALASITLTATPGITVLALLNQLRGLGLIARVRRDFTLQLFQSAGDDVRSRGVVLREGRHLGAPTQYGIPMSNPVNQMFVKGIMQISSSTDFSGALPERFEGWMQGPQTDDVLTLVQVAYIEVQRRLAARTAIALQDVDHGLGAGQFEPYRHYNRGDILGLDIPGWFANSPRVVAAINVASGERGLYTASVDLDTVPPDPLAYMAAAAKKVLG